MLDYTSGKRNRLYTATFRNGNVVSSDIRPEPKRDPKAWVPVAARDLRAVLDPISGLIFPDKGAEYVRARCRFSTANRAQIWCCRKRGAGRF